MKEFHEVADNIQEHFIDLYNKFEESGFKTIHEIENINGFYVFYEENKAQYVGRTNKKRMKERLKEHSANYSNKNAATFAYRIAKEMKNKLGLKEVILKDDKHFSEAKDKVRNMKIKTIEVDDPIIQTMFEPYLAFKLKTRIEDGKYNDFNTH